MTAQEVQELIRKQSGTEPAEHINHGVTLNQMLIPPQAISLILRSIHRGAVKDKTLRAWLVGLEKRPDGYSIVMSDDGSKFGLASKSFDRDKHLILTGWYGTLLDAYGAM